MTEETFGELRVNIPGISSFELEIKSIHEVRPHEITIPELLDSVKRDISRTGYQRDPILIDSSTKIILDGMHRRAALESVGAKYIVCADYDYLSREVVLQRWLRQFIAPDKKMVESLIELFDLRKISKVDLAIKTVDDTNDRIAVLSSFGSYVSEKKLDLTELYARIKKSDKLAQSMNLGFQFISESEILQVFSSESIYVIYPPRLSKSDVMEIALSGELLPFKTTRHVVPVRPMGLYFLTEHLAQKNLQENNLELEAIVRRSEIELADKGTWYEGRRYSEPLAVFRRRK